MATKKSASSRISSQETAALLQLLQTRFEKNMSRHKGMKWAEVQKRLESKPAKLAALQQMEDTGGEPDVVEFDKKTGEYIFCDCSLQSPAGRRSLCYDRAALNARKEHKPANSAIDLAAEMGIEMLDEAQYRTLQELGEFDTKTSSWLLTPERIRKLGGAVFGDRRYDTVFLYHNGADSYYGARGFRGRLRV
jgi:hypothetical protein